VLLLCSQFTPTTYAGNHDLWLRRGLENYTCSVKGDPAVHSQQSTAASLGECCSAPGCIGEPKMYGQVYVCTVHVATA
jgi:hypothetical protein